MNFWFNIVIIFSYGYFECLANSKIEERELNNLVRNMINDSSYNKEVRPNIFESQPIHVNVSLFINSLTLVSEAETQELIIDFYLRQYWQDSRLSFTPIKNITKMSLGGEFIHLVWLPDTFIPNSRSLQTHVSTSPAKGNTLLKLSSSGNILYSIRFTATLNCPTDLSHFPADKQRCHILLASYGYNIEDVIYRWFKESPENDSIILKQQCLPTFRVIGHRTNETIEVLSTGTYSTLIGEFFIERSMGFYVYQIYMPSFLIVVISFIPFWLGNDDHHARVSLGVTTVLTITTLITNTMQMLPKVPYLKAIDVYLFVCFIFVFFSLIEYAFVGYYESRRLLNYFTKKFRQSTDQQQHSLPEQHLKNYPIGKLFLTLEHTSKIDQFSRIIFPITFLLFNIIYVWYISTIKHHKTQLDLFNSQSN